jgi:predicted phage terminase large subunit-like protein
VVAKRKQIDEMIAEARKASNRALSIVSPMNITGAAPAGLPAWSSYIPRTPHEKQSQFLALDCLEALYGGAGFGGKSEALLMAALMYVDVPGYAAIIFQRQITDLALPGALIDRAHEWLDETDAVWDEERNTWTFPSGATLTFGYIKNYRDALRYKSTEFQFVGFEELTRFKEKEYRYLFSRLRRRKEIPVPLRMRAVTNPGDQGHEWVRQRFIVEGEKAGRVFIPAVAADNPHVSQEEYDRSLSELDPVTRAQLRDGNWDVREGGGLFQRGWFGRFKRHEVPLSLFRRLIRFYDLAATVPRPGKDPDWTATALVGLYEGRYYVFDIDRMRGRPGEVEKWIKKKATDDRALFGKKVEHVLEQEPGSSGVFTIDNFVRRVLVGFTARGKRSTGKKRDRAKPASSAAENGNVLLLEGGRWITPFLDEAEVFTGEDGGEHDDQVDALSGACEVLSGRSRRPVAW